MSPAPSPTAAWERAVDAIDERARRAYDGLIAALDGPAELLGARPEPGGWNMLEIGEHVVLADRFLMILVRKILERSRRRAAAGAAWPAHSPDLDPLESLLERPARWESPEHMLPTGSRTAEAIRRDLWRDAEALQATLRADPPGRGTLHRIRLSVLEGETQLDAYQYMLVIVLHAERHLAQMRRTWRAAGGA